MLAVRALLCALVLLSLVSCSGAPTPAVASSPTSQPAVPDPRAQLTARAYTDAEEIEASVRAASAVLAQVHVRVDAIATAAGAQGGTPTIAYDEIEALVAIEQPFHAGEFSRRMYLAFRPETVDTLFAYYLDVIGLWQRITHLQLATSSAVHRAALDRSAAAFASPSAVGVRLMGAAASEPTAECPSMSSALLGAVVPEPTTGIVGTLVYVEPIVGADGQPTGRVTARATRSGPGREMPVLTGAQRLDRSPMHVLLIDGGSSASVLASQAGAFRDFVRDLQELRTLLAATEELEQRLLEDLAEIREAREAAEGTPAPLGS